jgi:formylglycine-generating enzyme required for sulfatase activity
MAKKKRKPIRRKPQPAETQESQTEVRLKPFLGMSPGLYLTIIYAVAISFILFMLLFYKGLRDQGEYLHIDTFPSGAAVKVDGQYVGSSPCEVLVKKGTHLVTVQKPHYEPLRLEDGFRGPVFGTLFVRPRRELNIDLELSDPRALASEALVDFAANPHIPEILTETVWGGNNSASGAPVLSDFMDKSKFFVTNSLQLHSYLHAFSSLESGLGVLTPATLLSAVDKIIQLNQKHENFPFWLAVVLQEEASQRVVDTLWFSRLVSEYRARYEGLQAQSEDAAGPGSAVSPIVIRGIRFFEVPAGKLLQGAAEGGFATVQLPHPVDLPSFYMSEIEIPNRTFRAFIEDNPRWDPENKQSLMEEGLVDQEYLSAWRTDPDEPGWEELPVTHVSFFAAQAFCQWFSSRLPPSVSDHSARLPFESEWEWAARGGLVGADYPSGRPSETSRFYAERVRGPSAVGSSSQNLYGLRDMAGNVWEWCLDWYSPVKYLFTSWSAENNDFDSSEAIPFGAEKVIRGGSWANEQELIKVSTRGSQPPDWCTPYLGFRAVLSRYSP